MSHDEDVESPSLTPSEMAAVEHAEADVKAGRLHDHDDVAKRRRACALEIALPLHRNG
ncbi:MAG TPA: hypothetical protein VJ487_13350 [Alphaproteobacteria bacterium]|nr:hypothetical protein [Alphaproteobacteria bacterium]